MVKTMIKMSILLYELHRSGLLKCDYILYAEMVQ